MRYKNGEQVERLAGRGESPDMTLYQLACKAFSIHPIKR